jgi:hypothetical protein
MCNMSNTVGYEMIEYEGKPARLYPDGSIRNEKGHWLAQHPGAYTIDSSNASSLAARRHERKREIIRQTAAEAVERGEWRDRWGEDAWVAAITEAQYIKATTPDDPKSTDAARFLLKEAGYSEPETGAEGIIDATTALVRELAAFAATVGSMNAGDNSNYRKHDVIGAEESEDE